MIKLENLPKNPGKSQKGKSETMKPIHQSILAIIMASVMLLSFIGVYIAGYQYETYQTENSTIMWQSDSNMQFQELDVSQSVPLWNYTPYGIGTFRYWGDSLFPTYEEGNNCTPIYAGNNTWTASMLGFSTGIPEPSAEYFHYPVLIPQAKTFLADTIDFTITVPASDGDINLLVLIGANNNPERVDFSGLSTQPILDETIGSAESTVTRSITLTTFQKLLWYQGSNNADESAMWFYVIGTDRLDGISSYALELTITITGVPITTWSLQDSINLVLVIGIASNIVIIIYASDGVDLNAIRKDLPGKTKKYVKKVKAKAKKTKKKGGK